MQSFNHFRLSVLSVGVLETVYGSPVVAVEPMTTFQTLTVYADSGTNLAQHETVNHATQVKASQAGLLAEYLPTVAGVTVGGTSGMDENIYIRGLGADNAGSQLKITVDGVRQPETKGFHHAGISGIDPDLVKATEVAVGNNSLTLGNNAIGGGVAFTTVGASDLLRPNQTVGATVKTGYASNDKQLHTTLTAYTAPNDTLDMLVSYGERHSDGGEDGNGQHIQGDNIVVKNVLAKVNVKPRDGHQLTASYSHYDNTGDYPFRPNIGYQRNLPNNIQQGFFRNQSLSLGYTATPSDTLEITAKAYHLTNEAQSQGVRNNKPMIIGTAGKTDGLSATVKQQVSQAHAHGDWQHGLTYGIEGYQKSATLNSNHATEQATSIGAYLEDRIDMGRWVLTPAVRFDHYQPSDRLSDKTYRKLSGALAGEWRVNPDTTLFASHTQLFNGPPLPETLQQNGQTLVNSDLQAETGANSELGFHRRFNAVLTDTDTLNLTAKYFHTDYDNKITRLTGIDCVSGKAIKDEKCASFSNAGNSRVTGYEINANYRQNALSVNASYAHAKSRTANGYQLGKDSGDQFNMGVNYQVSKNFSLGSHIRHVASLTRQTSATARTDLPSFTTYDVFGSYRPATLPNVTLDAGVYNLTNTAYAEHVSNTTDLAMGRNIKVTMRYRF